MHSIRFTILLLLVLFIPFFFRRQGFEPYPAIFLPEGPTVISKKNDTVKFYYTELLGLDEQKKWQKLDPIYLLSPIRMKSFEDILLKQYDTAYVHSPKYLFLKKHHLLKASDQPHSADKWFSDK